MFHRSARLAAVTAVGALTLALGACSSGSDTEGTEGAGDLAKNRVGAMENFSTGTQFKATEALKFSVLYSNHTFYPEKNDWLFWSELTKRTGVTLDPTIVPMSDYSSKRSLLVGSGNAPFIIPKTYPPSETQFVSSGAVLPVSDYFDLMPNLQDKVKKWGLQNQIDTLRQADNKIYVLPGLHEDVWPDYTLAIRTDILKELNLQSPKTWDELHSVLTAMKKAYPKIYPFSDRWGSHPDWPAGSLFQILGQSFGTRSGWTYNNAYWDATAKKYVTTGTMPQYKAMITYLAALVKEGLLDPESFTQTDDQAKQKFANSQGFVMSTNAQTLVNEMRPPLAKVNPKATVEKIAVPIGPAGEIKDWSRLENGVMISSKAKDSPNFVAMMQFVDWLWYSDAGQEFAKWGVPGVTYDKDASGKRTLNAGVDFVGLNPTATKHLQKDFGFSNGVFTYGGTTELLNSTFSPEEQEFQKVMGARKAIDTPAPHPFTADEQEQIGLWETPLKDYVKQQTLRFVLGQRDLGEWDKYVSEVNAKGAQKYVDMVNQATERYAKEHAS
jgi:putative aldouronate transport system substrate-binding protein